MSKPPGRVIRTRRNTGPVGGAWICELGFWIEDTLRGKRDRFHVTETVKVGTRSECKQAELERVKTA